MQYIVWWAVTSLLVIKFLGGQLVARKPYLMQTYIVAAYFYKNDYVCRPEGKGVCIRQIIIAHVITYTYNLTDDDIFNLWDTSNLILVTFTE